MDRLPQQIVETVGAAKLTMVQLEERLSGVTDTRTHRQDWGACSPSNKLRETS